MKKTAVKTEELKIGVKIGRLIIETIAKSYTQNLYLCRCECGQLVPRTAINLRGDSYSNQCINCDERDFAKSFQINDVVFVCRSHYGFLLKEQAIVASFAESAGKVWIEIEWRGRLYSHEPSFLINTGVKF